MYPAIKPAAVKPTQKNKPIPLATIEARIHKATSRRALLKLATRAFAEGEATFLYAQHCDWGDARLCCGDASRCATTAAYAIDKANRIKATP